MSILGNRVLRVEDPKFLTVGGTYVDDLRIPVLDGAAHVTYVRSTMAHARLTSIDVERGARPRPAWSPCSPPPTSTCADLPPSTPMLNPAMARPFLARDGRASSASRSRPSSPSDPSRAPTPPSSVCSTTTRCPRSSTRGGRSPTRSCCPRRPAPTSWSTSPSAAPTTSSTAARSSSPQDRQPAGRAVPLEVPGRGRRVGRRPPHPVVEHPGRPRLRDTLAERPTASTPEQVRVITPDVGGGFGAKIGGYPEELAARLAGQQVGRPVRWIETRTENMVGLGHGRGQVQTSRSAAARRHGRRLPAHVLQDAGAYPRSGRSSRS